MQQPLCKPDLALVLVFKQLSIAPPSSSLCFFLCCRSMSRQTVVQQAVNMCFLEECEALGLLSLLSLLSRCWCQGDGASCILMLFELFLKWLFMHSRTRLAKPGLTPWKCRRPCTNARPHTHNDAQSGAFMAQCLLRPIVPASQTQPHISMAMWGD